MIRSYSTLSVTLSRSTDEVGRLEVETGRHGQSEVVLEDVDVGPAFFETSELADGRDDRGGIRGSLLWVDGAFRRASGSLMEPAEAVVDELELKFEFGFGLELESGFNLRAEAWMAR